MIPKIIHYCWFGPKPLPPEVQECIDSWEKYCPDYQIKLWNEANFPIAEFPFAQSALKAKKYAYIADVCRVFALYHHGGVYMDTDMELIKPIDNLLDNPAFIGFEDHEYIAAGIIGSEKNGAFVKDILNKYIEIGKADFSNGNYFNYTIPRIITAVLSKFEISSDRVVPIKSYCTVFPHEYFYPKNYINGVLSITKNSYGIHHYDASWFDDDAKQGFITNQKRNAANVYLEKVIELSNDRRIVYNLTVRKLELSNSTIITWALKDMYKNFKRRLVKKP